MSKKRLISCIAATILLIALDQFTKFLAVSKLKNSDPFVLIDGVFEFYYVENRGVAWGAFSGKLGWFVAITLVILPLVMFAIHRIGSFIDFFGNKINVKAMRFLQLDLFLLIAGAIGNLIDRTINGYVVDFLYFKLIDFPVFNVADCYVTVATVLLLIISIIWLKSEELDILLSSKKKWQVKDECK